MPTDTEKPKKKKPAKPGAKTGSRTTPKKPPKKPVAENGNRRTVDLDAYRAARDEEQGLEGPVVIIAEDEYELPAQLPASVVFVLSESIVFDEDGKAIGGNLQGLREALSDLFGEDWKTVYNGPPKMSADEVLYLLGSIVEGYGFTAPESSASADS